VFSCSGNDLAVPYDPNPSGDDVLAIVGGHLDVHSPPVAFEVGWHLRVSIAIPKAAYLSFVGVYCSSKLVDAAVCFGELLVSEGCALAYRRDKAICDSPCSVGKVVVLHAEDGFS